MTITIDPAGNETRALLALSGELTGKTVLEIGCGDGRLTWRFAEHAGMTTAIDPNGEKISRAQAQTPKSLSGKVEFLNQSLEAFCASRRDKPPIDLVILAWSL